MPRWRRGKNDSERTATSRPVDTWGSISDFIDTYSTATTDQLEGDVVRSRDDDDLATKAQQAEVNRLNQANELRSLFFWISSMLAFGAVATSIALVIGIVFFNRDISDAVAVAFISGLAVETIGILAVMGGYLFPRDKDPEQKRERD